MLQNKTIFITGATAGFGLACAKLFVAQGARVIATGRRVERLEELKKECDIISSPLEGEDKGGGLSQQFQSVESTPHPIHPPQGGRVYAIPLDVRDNDAVLAAVRSLPKEFSKVDVLINNAGLALGLASYESQTHDDIEQMIDTNIKGVLYATSALLPGMIERNSGHIVNLGSIAGTYPYPGGNVYGATKAFIEQFSLNLRADLLGKNIRVTNIEPGMCDTEFSSVRFHGDDKKADAVYAGMTPLSAQDIAQTILWCLDRPAHVNINRVEIMPVQQAFSPFAVSRTGKL